MNKERVLSQIAEEISEAATTINFLRELINGYQTHINIPRSHLGYRIPSPFKQRIKGFMYTYHFRRISITEIIDYSTTTKGVPTGRYGMSENFPTYKEYVDVGKFIHDLKIYIKELNRVYDEAVKKLKGG